MEDNVATRHEDYEKWSKRWSIIDDAIDGEHRVKERRGLYLKPLSGMDTASIDINVGGGRAYDTYLERARWYAAPGRAMAALLGLVSRRPVSFTVDDALVDVVWDDLNGHGEGINELTLQAIAGILKTARPLLLVDYTDAAETPLGKGRAFIDVVPAENVINWREKDGEFELLVIQRAELRVDSKSEFRTQKVAVYSVYRLEEGVVTYQRYEETVPSSLMMGQINASPNANTIVPGDKKLLKVMDKPMTTIPARFITIVDDSFSLETPPIEPICDHAFHYYRVSADRGWGLHHIGLPTPIFTGVQAHQLPPGLGPSIIVGLPAGATFGMLSYTGQGLDELSNELTDIKAEIADYGARLLESRARVGEATSTVETKMMSDSASLSMIANSTARVFTWALKLFHDLSGRKSSKVEVSIDTDFISLKLSGTELTALVNAYLTGALPLEVFFNNLKEGSVVDQEMDIADFERQLHESRAIQDELLGSAGGGAITPQLPPGQGQPPLLDRGHAVVAQPDHGGSISLQQDVAAQPPGKAVQAARPPSRGRGRPKKNAPL